MSLIPVGQRDPLRATPSIGMARSMLGGTQPLWLQPFLMSEHQERLAVSPRDSQPQSSRLFRPSLLCWLAFSLFGLPALGLFQAAQFWLADHAPATLVQTIHDNWLMFVLGAAAPLGALERFTWLKENAPRLRGLLIGAYVLVLVIVFVRILGGFALGLGLVAASQASLGRQARWAIKAGSFVMGLVGLGISLVVCLALPDALNLLDTDAGAATSSSRS